MKTCLSGNGRVDLQQLDLEDVLPLIQTADEDLDH